MPAWMSPQSGPIGRSAAARRSAQPAPAMGDQRQDGKFYTGSQYGWQSGPSAAKNGLLGSEVLGSSAFASAPAPAPAAAPPRSNVGWQDAMFGGRAQAAPVSPAGLPAPALERAAHTARQLNPAGAPPAIPAPQAQAPQVQAPQVQGTPIAPGASDLAKASSQISDVAMNAGALDPAMPANTAAGGEVSMDLDARRRRAFLDAPDSLEGMKRVRQVLADEIQQRGGDLQKFAADSNQMRPMSVQQLEGYMQTLQGSPANAADDGNMQMSYQMQPSDLAKQAAAGIGPDSMAAAAGAAADGINPTAAYQMQPSELAQQTAGAMRPADFDRFLSTSLKDTIAANPANSNNAILPYQTNTQVMPGENGAPDANGLASGAAMGMDPASLTPDAMRATYTAQNANALFGGGKRGATVPLPQLTDEELKRMSGSRTSWVTPPAGFENYNRRAS